MGARQDEQRSVCRIRAIQMQAQSQHVLKNAHGWLDVGNAVLDRPSPEPGPAERRALVGPWCHPTTQLARGSLSKRRARVAKAPVPMTGSTNVRSDSAISRTR